MPKLIKPKAAPLPKPVPIRTVDAQGNVYYTLPNGNHHREDGPAIEYISGRKDWFINGHHHRVDGPAVITERGDKFWMVNGTYHREDGPALQYNDGRKTYYLNGSALIEKTFNTMVQDIKMRKALRSLEKFSDKYGDGKQANKAGLAVMKFLQGACDHTFETKNNACELCDSQ